MPSAQNQPKEFSMNLLSRNHLCRGVKHGNEYRYGGDANEDTVNDIVKLLDEAIKRARRWRVLGNVADRGVDG